MVRYVFTISSCPDTADDGETYGYQNKNTGYDDDRDDPWIEARTVHWFWTAGLCLGRLTLAESRTCEINAKLISKWLQ